MIRNLSILLLLFIAVPATACFGPKLFLGVGDDATGQVLASFVAIYVKETTGTEVERIPLEGRDPSTEIGTEKIDFAFTDQSMTDTLVLMSVAGLPQLISGPRIDNDLQFTTVRPSLARLEKKLSAEDVTALTKKVEAGELAMDVVRHLLIERRWI